MKFDKLAVIGGGAWGTALAQVAATGDRETILWALEDDVVTAVNKIHENPVYLKGQKLSPAIRATSNFSDLAEADAWLVVTTVVEDAGVEWQDLVFRPFQPLQDMAMIETERPGNAGLVIVATSLDQQIVDSRIVEGQGGMAGVDEAKQMFH